MSTDESVFNDDRLAHIKCLLSSVDSSIGPDSSLRWLIKEVDRLRAQQEATAGELKVLRMILEKMVRRLGEAFAIDSALTDPIRVTRMVVRQHQVTKEDNIALTDKLTEAIGYNPCPGVGGTRVAELVDYLIYQLRGLRSEEVEIHDLAAEALGYERAPSLEEDPNCPCPGDFVTGDHTAQTLVTELVSKYTRMRETNG